MVSLFDAEAYCLQLMVAKEGLRGYIAMKHERLKVNACILIFLFPKIVETYYLD